MSDFELPIINAVKTNIGENVIKGCFFHLCQNVYRGIQSEGLQEQYNHPIQIIVLEMLRTCYAIVIYRIYLNWFAKWCTMIILE